MIVGTAGHIDHGKTALVRALTGVDTDRLKEEKARGISIDLGFAYKPAASGEVLGFVDVPGHERFVHTMLAGASGIDFVLLAVAADDGVMPQTREHLAIVDLLGIGRGIVALTKADLAGPQRRDMVRAEIRAALAGTALESADIVPVSVITGEGIADLGRRLEEAAAAFAAREASGRFRLAIDRSFTLHGAGTVVTGTVLSGSVAVGDHLVVSPSGLAARVRSIHAQNRPAERGRAGERCAVNLAGDRVTREAIVRGDVLLDPGLHAPTARIDAVLRVLPGEPRSIGQWFPVRFHTAATEVGARIVLLGDDPVPPGGEAFVQLVLEQPIAATVGDRYVVRDTSAQRTIGGGRLVDLRAPARKRRTPERLAQLAAHAREAAGEALAALLATPPRLVDLGEFGRDRALGETGLTELADRLGLVRIAAGGRVVALSGEDWQRLKTGLGETLDAFHADNPDLPGIGLERLRLQSQPRLPAPAFLAVLRGLAREGEVALDGAWVRRPGHVVQLTAADEAMWQEIRPLLGGESRFRPPRVRDIAGGLGIDETRVRQLLKRTGRMGLADEVAHDHFFLRATVAEMVAILRRLADSLPQGQFTAAQFRDQLDNGRKVAIQILEFLDRHGVTLRRGDLRRLDPHRLDLFGVSTDGGESSPVGRPDFKSGWGREPVPGGFDSHSLPPPGAVAGADPGAARLSVAEEMRMQPDRQVASHYASPELERRILDALAAAGIDIDRLRPADLAPVDEFHLGWLPATEELAAALGLTEGMRLLDIGSGIGGPARFFAERCRCRVAGIDLTEDYVRVAAALTGRCGLADRVQFQRASALALPFAAGSFDAATLIHVGMNIADKATLFAEARRVLRPGGLFAVYEVMRAGEGEIAYPTPWAAGPETSFVEPVRAYRERLADAGFAVESERDRRAFVLEMAARMRAQTSREGPPALGLHVVVGAGWRERARNMMAALEAGTIAPVEIIARA